MAQPLPPHVPASLAGFLRRDGEWLRCAEPNCGDRAFWGIFRDGVFLRAKVAAHRAKVHAGRAARPQAGRPQRRAAAAPAAGMSAALMLALASAAADMAAHQARLGRGAFREVFPLGPDLVVKIGRKDHNLAEKRDYDAASPNLREWLCPALMVAPDGAWLICRRASRVGDLTHSERSAVRTALRGQVGDLHEANMGMLDGHPVAIDYGFGVGAANAW